MLRVGNALGPVACWYGVEYRTERAIQVARIQNSRAVDFREIGTLTSVDRIPSSSLAITPASQSPAKK